MIQTRFSILAEAFVRLALHDLFMAFHSLSALTERTRKFPVRRAVPKTPADELVRAVDLASCFYPKPVLCLQRSAVLIRLLRSRGIAGRMVIGTQKIPFKAHAWVEIDGRILSDRSAERERYLVMEEC